MKDVKQKTPQQYDGQNLFKDVFITVWDAGKQGNLERLTQLIAPKEADAAAKEAAKHPVDDGTPWLKNTPLHLAVKAKQVKAVKLLIWDLNANPMAQNGRQ